MDLGMIKARVRMDLCNETFKSTSPSERELKKAEVEAFKRYQEKTANLMEKIEQFYEVPEKIERLGSFDESTAVGTVDRIVDQDFKNLVNIYARNIENLSRGNGIYTLPKCHGNEEFAIIP